jgi:gag-polyprotein putative aspartyl protease
MAMIERIRWSGRALLRAVVVVAVVTGVGLPVAEGADCKLALLSEWPIKIDNSRLLVEGAVNGQPVQVMLDTGSPRTMLDRTAAKRLNVMRRDVEKRDRILAAGTEARLEIASLDEFRVVDFKRTPWRLVISPERDLAADVLLGEDFLSLVDLEFDLEKSVLRLFKPENCEGKKLAYWASEGQSVGEVAIDPLIAANPQIVFDVATSVLDKPAASRLGATPETAGVTVVGERPSANGKMLTVWSAPFQSFAIGTETAKDVRLPFSEVFRDASYSSLGSHVPTKGEGAQQMLLGVDFLRSHRVLVSHSQKRIYFTHNGGPMFRPTGSPEAKAE